MNVLHRCTGESCLHCKMARHGYVRSAVIDRWWRPDRPGSPLLTDEEAAQWTPLKQMELFAGANIDT